MFVLCFFFVPIFSFIADIFRTVAVYEEKIWAEVEKRIEAEFGSRNKRNYRETIRECIEKRNYMSVFKLSSRNSSGGIDITILKALLKSNNNTRLLSTFDLFIRLNILCILSSLKTHGPLTNKRRDVV